MADSQNIDPTATNWLVRAYYTPVGDALRGSLSARLDVRHTIAAAGLPAPLGSLIYTICRRTRLWRREKHDVARELVAHFADGISAGRSSEELVKDFGPPEQAAKLIRRAKLRNRPLWWQTWRIASRLFLLSVVAVSLAYAALSARFHLGRPTIAHNYWHEINDARKVAEEDRAWPIYRAALLKFGKDELDPDWMEDGPTGKDWHKAVEVLERHRETLELVRRGAQKPYLGYFLGDPTDRRAAIAAHQDWIFNEESADDNKNLISAMIEGIQNQRRLARLLNANARLAAMNSDGARALADLMALIAMSEQLFQPESFLVDQLIGVTIFGVAMDTLGTILSDTPHVFSEAQLRDLAHRVATFRQGSTALDFTTERMMFDDLLQRAYTDDGNGDGRITPEGLRMLADLVGDRRWIFAYFDPDPREDRALIGNALLSPGVAAMVGTRQENRELFHEMLNEMIAAHRRPSWQWDMKTIDAQDERLAAITHHPADRLRYLFVGAMMPALSAANSAGERAAQFQGAAEVAIALVLWQRRHGDWPATLDELVPVYLPAVPPDRADGKPLRYAVIDGKPMVYSIGADRDDDGGRFHAEDPDRTMVIRFGPPPAHPSGADDGDWILWPPPERTPSSAAADEGEPSS